MGEGKELDEQRQKIEKVVKWLREDGYEPEEKTHLHQDFNYFAIVMVSKDKGFHVIFPKNPLDKVIISEMVSMDEKYRKAYKALPAIQQNKFYFDLKISLLEMDVMFMLENGIRELQSLEVNKVIYFDGLTKDRFFHTVFTVGHAIEIARTK